MSIPGGLLWLLPLAVAATSVLTNGLRRYAIKNRVLDIPNNRSSHTTPIPRGGGVAMLAVYLPIVGVLAGTGLIDAAFAVALIGSGSIVGLVGFLDDHRSVAVRWRLLAHIFAATWVLWWLSGLPPLEIGAIRLEAGPISHALAVAGLVWLLNLYNFMDGVDGIAGFEAVTVCLAAAGIYWHRELGAAEWLVPALLAMSALGFLVWNWPPAKIFMGDAGSGFLGLMLGAMTIRSASFDPRLLWVWLILLGVFVVDATVTLLRRVSRREKIHESHSEHGYQHAARRYSHNAITLGAGAINVFWLLPLAIAVERQWLAGPTALVVAYAPLVLVAFAFRAGFPAQPSLKRAR